MSGSSPNLHHSDSSLLLRTRKSNHDVRLSLVDERVFGDNGHANESEEQDGLLLESSQVIEMNTWTPSTPLPLYKSKKSPQKCPLSAKSIAKLLASLILLGFFFAVIKLVVSELDRQSAAKNTNLYHNGTDYFAPTVIYISLDGFRNDYLDRKVTPNIDLIAEQGIRAQYMHPSFPSITFPNHWTLVTGLYPEAHGIVANEFYDPQLKQDFIHKVADISEDPKWWGGEPIWVTATKQGKKSAVIMWPGSNVLINGINPDYYVPYIRGPTAIDKMDIILNWLDLPLDQRPQLVSIYVPQIDQKGHGGGPDGNQLNSVLSDADTAIGHLMAGLNERNIDKHVHLVVVSDHGMAGSDKSRLIFYDKILSTQAQSWLRKREAWPLLGLRPKDDAPEDAVQVICQELSDYTTQVDNPHFSFYERKDIPARFHYNSTERIAPIILVPEPGYSIIHSKDYNPDSGKPYTPKGIHGYDNMALEMRAIFAARGPKLDNRYSPGTIVAPFVNIEMYRFLTTLLDLEPAPNNSTLDGVFRVLDT